MFRHFMFSRQLFLMISLLCVLSVSLFAQEDSDPNSPSPILLSIEDTNRVVAVDANKTERVNLFKVKENAFAPESEVVLYLTNVELMKGEEANAFRLYAEDSKGRLYRFPVLGLEPIEGKEWIYALTVRLQDELGFWEQPSPDGDLLVYVTWRGLASNTLRLGFGMIGGEIKDNGNTTTAPVSKFFKNPPTPEDDPSRNYVGYRFSGDRKRFLEQATFGPTVALDQRIRRIGLRTWLAEQFAMDNPTTPYPVIPMRPTNAPGDCDGDNSGGGTPPNPVDVPLTCNRDTYGMYLPQQWFWTEALYGNAQLRHRTVWALQQLWVISGANGTTQQSSHMFNYNQILSRHAFGNYRDLMREVTLSPGMGNYLDMVRSTRNNPNENYAREILQLFAVGLFEMNNDGTYRLDGNNELIPTYTQDTVNNFSKVFTGWNYCNVQGAECPSAVAGANNYKDPMRLNTANHDLTVKTLFNYAGAPSPTIAACTPSPCNAAAITPYANNSLNAALDNIFQHPNVPPFVSKIMIQHLVTSDPSPAYVGRVSAVFRNNGFGVRGDMKAVVRAILLDPEARGDFKTDPNFGKLREPVQLFTNVARHFNVRGAGTNPLSDGIVNSATSGLGQSVFNSPTVFNYFPPDYVIPGTALLGPEFMLLTTGTSVSRANMMNTYVINNGLGVAAPDRPLGTMFDFAELQAIAAADTTSAQLIETLNQRMLHGRMPTAMRTSITTAVNIIPTTNPNARARQAAYLVATSSQFQVQR